MKIELNDSFHLVFKEIYSHIIFVSDDKEEFTFCIRDGGFEFSYGGKWYSAKGGVLEQIPYMQSLKPTSILVSAATERA